MYKLTIQMEASRPEFVSEQLPGLAAVPPMSQYYPLQKPHPFSSSPTANPNNPNDNQPQAYTNQDRRTDPSRATITIVAPRASNLFADAA